MKIFVAIGFMLLIVSFTTFIMGSIRKFFPTTEKYVPDDLKAFLSLQYALYYLFGGLLLIVLFS